MRVLTFNIQSCRAGVDRVAEVLKVADADVMLLTEVRRKHLRALARATGTRATFGRTWRFRPFGNAILTRDRHRRVLHVRYTRTPMRQPRGMIAVRLPNGVTVAVTHLGLDAGERVGHARELIGALSNVPDPVVLGGDMNDAPGGPAVSVLLWRFKDAFPAVGAEPSMTHPAEAPVRRIDYIFVSGLAVKNRAVVPVIASDHLAVVAELA